MLLLKIMLVAILESAGGKVILVRYFYKHNKLFLYLFSFKFTSSYLGHPIYGLRHRHTDISGSIFHPISRWLPHSDVTKLHKFLKVLSCLSTTYGKQDIRPKLIDTDTVDKLSNNCTVCIVQYYNINY